MTTEEQMNTPTTMEFQAEVKQLLDIVIHSLYTDKEIFLRELISNGADALEKLRYMTLTQKEIYQPELPLEINIEVKEEDKTIIVQDNGIGMTKEELIENLGTIAHSGSKAFLKRLQEGHTSNDLSLIGQFGVGFYAAFMVAKQVEVITHSYEPDALGYRWTSDGTGNYTIVPEKDIKRGTSIVLTLKDDELAFASVDNIRRIVKRYSGFVPFTVNVNGEKINTIQAIWALNKNEIKEEEYAEFYQYIANAYDQPLYRLHFSVDAPLSINALLYVPGENLESIGFGKLEPGVNLYCRKVLIQQHAENLLPDWLRFLKGVVDSEEIPLNISRETMQDSALMAKLRKVITSRFLKFLAEQAKQDPEAYIQFWKNFGEFLKVGIASDFQYRKELAPLLRFESSRSNPGEYISLTDYVSRMQNEQKNIYFINGASREVIEAGPYLEAFKSRDIEVIYTHEPIDDFVLNNLAEFEEKKLISADQSVLDLPDTTQEKPNTPEKLDASTIQELTAWLSQALEGKVAEVKESHRLVDSPAVLINLDGHITGSMQRVLQQIHDTPMPMVKKALEINPSHDLIKGLSELRTKDENFAKLVADQLYDNALIASGMSADPKTMVERMYNILTRAVTSQSKDK